MPFPEDAHSPAVPLRAADGKLRSETMEAARTSPPRPTLDDEADWVLEFAPVIVPDEAPGRGAARPSFAAKGKP